MSPGRILDKKPQCSVINLSLTRPPHPLEMNDTEPCVGWSGGTKVLGILPVPGRPTIMITVGQGPIALAVGASGGGLDILTLIYSSFPHSPSLWRRLHIAVVGWCDGAG